MNDAVYTPSSDPSDEPTNPTHPASRRPTTHDQVKRPAPRTHSIIEWNTQQSVHMHRGVNEVFDRLLRGRDASLGVGAGC